jgi:hypothetical protein
MGRSDAKRFPEMLKDNSAGPTSYKTIEAFEKVSPRNM